MTALLLTRLTIGVILMAGAALAKPSKFEGWRLPLAPAPGPHGPHEMKKHHHYHGGDEMTWGMYAPAPGPEDYEEGHHEHKHMGESHDHHDDDHRDSGREHHDAKHADAGPGHKDKHPREEPKADILFFLPASTATFPRNDTLVLSGVTTAVLYNAAGGKAGVVSTAAFTNTTAGSRYVAPNGTWLHSPVAALFGNAGPYGNGAMLLSLRSPVYDFSVQTITFNVTVLPAIETILTTTDGVTAELVNQAFYEARPVAQSVTPGTVWSDVGLFIDANRGELHGARDGSEDAAEGMGSLRGGSKEDSKDGYGRRSEKNPKIGYGMAPTPSESGRRMSVTEPTAYGG